MQSIELSRVEGSDVEEQKICRRKDVLRIDMIEAQREDLQGVVDRALTLAGHYGCQRYLSPPLGKLGRRKEISRE